VPTATTNSWHDQTTERHASFVVGNVFWQTVFSLLKKSVRTAAAYLQLLGRVPPLGVMVEGFIALKNVMWKARAGSKKNHVLPAGSFFTQ